MLSVAVATSMFRCGSVSEFKLFTVYDLIAIKWNGFTYRRLANNKFNY